MTTKAEVNLLRRFNRWCRKIDNPHHTVIQSKNGKLFIIRDTANNRNHVFSYDDKVNEWISENVVKPEYLEYHIT